MIAQQREEKWHNIFSNENSRSTLQWSAHSTNIRNKWKTLTFIEQLSERKKNQTKEQKIECKQAHNRAFVKSIQTWWTTRINKAYSRYLILVICIKLLILIRNIQLVPGFLFASSYQPLFLYYPDRRIASYMRLVI